MLFFIYATFKVTILLYNFTIMILVADMQTVKFRRSRVVMLVGFLILVSSAGYWFMYVSSHPDSRLSDIPNYVDTVNLRQSHSHKYIQSNKLTKPQLGQSNSVKNDANVHNDDVDWHNEKRHSFKHGKGYKQTNAERRGTELKGDDYSEEEAIDDVIQSKNVDAAAQVGHAREHSNDELPAGHHGDDNDELPAGHHGDDNDELPAGHRADDNDADKLHKKDDKKVSGIKGEVGVYNLIDSPQADDDYDDNDNDDAVINLRKKDATRTPAKNMDKFHDTDNDRETRNRPQSQGSRRWENAGDNDDVEVENRHGERNMIGRQRAPVEAQSRNLQEGAKQQAWSRERDVPGGESVDRLKSDREILQRQSAEAWRLQQANDGVQASHQRSHNIAPLPRVYGRSRLKHVDSEKQVDSATRSSQLDDVVDNIDGGSSRQTGRMTSTKFYIIHSGLASRVNAALHPNLHVLPDHIQPESYIFTSNRSE